MNILQNENLKKIWEEELSEYRQRIRKIRIQFGQAVREVFGDKTADDIIKGHGFLCQVPFGKR